ncbi:MAG: hypothetical protein Q7U66_13790 [Methylobacter sp.]|nr:hypothetical protein [Methylobacter sp.]
MPREDYDSDQDYRQAINDELELLEYYQEKNVFWVPKAARWSTLKGTAALPIDSVIWQNEQGEDVKLRSISWLVDNALDEIESEKFIDEHAKEKHDNPAEQKKHISVYGQESNPTTWKLAAMIPVVYPMA